MPAAMPPIPLNEVKSMTYPRFRKYNSIDDLRRLIGYLIVSFLAVFLYVPFLWLASIWGMNSQIYLRWVLASGLILVFNVAFYFWRYPEQWLKNLILLAAVNVFLVVLEYVWIIQGL
ncbi:hypothetical protein CEB3_c24420 [Peptococcaceae bacterium CEB3]|nr:hypothetical protein CEB3_c24420 [Peptococcaceae bacterium CEB3]